MTTWGDAVAAIEAAREATDTSRGRSPRKRAHYPIIVMGYAGSGKTAIWRQLTGSLAPDARSEDIDQEWFSLPRTRRRAVITTIPGQISEQRTRKLERYFGSDTIVRGVIFVASFGFNHIWPQQADVVAAELAPVDMVRISDWNMKRELESFHETCNAIRRKYLMTTAAARRPQWLLVLVNKIDLYWDSRDVAAEYYLPLPASTSVFNDVATRLKQDLGQLSQFQYSVLPMTTDPGPYVFRANAASFEIESQLDDRHARASFVTLGATLEALGGF